MNRRNDASNRRFLGYSKMTTVAQFPIMLRAAISPVKNPGLTIFSRVFGIENGVF